MNKLERILASSAASLLFLLGAPIALADDEFPGDVEQGDRWQASPFDFVFGNHIDTHIQLALKAKKERPRRLKGSLYVYFTGEKDEASGLPIARHPRGASHDERCGIDPIVCVAAWKLVGRPGAAKYLYHSGVNGNDHPVWMVNRAEEPTAPAPGMVIPQPGHYSHFHWITSGSTDPRAVYVPIECEKANAGQLQDSEPTAVDEICMGWFLQLKATRNFAFSHGGEIIPIRRGQDMRSHLNIVMNYDETPVVPITPTRTSGSH